MLMAKINNTSRKSKQPEQQGREAGWFGYQEVDPREKTSLVHAVFASVAPRYDLMNDLMSGGIHRLWKRRFVAAVAPKRTDSILDLAGGTGDITQLMRAKAPGVNVTLCDINEAMVQAGLQRALDKGQLRPYKAAVGNAESLPFPDNSFDAVTISFGLRNVTNIDAGLAEITRVLKPGGRFYCLEFSRVAKPLQPLYDLYSFSVLPRLGRFIANDEASYRYLAESIRQFPPQPELAARMAEAGLENTSWTDLSAGIAAIHSGTKPLAKAAKTAPKTTKKTTKKAKK